VYLEIRSIVSGVFISGSSVRSIWVRHQLENFKKRLKGLSINSKITLNLDGSQKLV